jgi:hypothetical protein
VLLALALGGCSDAVKERGETSRLALQPALNLGDCSAAWVPITGGNRSDSEPPAELLFSGGDLFFFRFEWGVDGATTSELVRFDVHSPSRELATSVLVPNAFSAPMWVDDNDLVFTQNGEVRSVPMSGGDTRVRSTYGTADLGDIRWLGISNGNFYFARYGQPGAIWKVSLGGGPVELFANLGPDWGYQIEPPLVPSTEGLLLNGQLRADNGADRRATILISGEGAVRELAYPEGSSARPFLTPTGVIHIVDPPKAAPPAKPDAKTGDSTKTGAAAKIGNAATAAAAATTGATKTGTSTSSGSTKTGTTPAQASDGSSNRALHEIEDDQVPAHPDLQMWLTPLRGSEMTEFWTERPASALPAHVESDGRDGWFVTATEPFNDGYLHDTLWHVRPNAEARRLACNPSPESSQIQTESRTGHAFAYGDGSVYLVSLRGESQFWELVQISYLTTENER